MKKKILILGGCGYKGTELSLALSKKFDVHVVDTMWFGKKINEKKNLKIFKDDIRNLKKNYFKNVYAVIHLANVANDPAVELNPSLSWEINVLALKKVIEESIKNKVKKFIYASSGSVYGIKKEKKVTANLSLVPISTYNKTKMIAERVLFSYKNDIKIYSIRPSTVCGLSKRMRFDISVNILTLQALKYREITLFGGKQIRPNIHIKDMIRVYEHFLKKNIKPGAYNAGFENISLMSLSKKIKKIIKCKIRTIMTNDPRSYRIDSSKLLKTGFKPKYSVLDAILDIKDAYEKNKIKDDITNYNVKLMKKYKLN